MKKIECTFYRPEKVSIREFSNIVRKMEKDLDTFCREPIDEIYRLYRKGFRGS